MRDLARDLGKDVELVLEGKGPSSTRRSSRRSATPCCTSSATRSTTASSARRAHPARQGDPKSFIVIRAQHEARNIKIVIEDDGAGLDLEAIKRKALQKGILREADKDTVTDHELRGLIFAPDFSADIITDVSGRGVGIDVVKQRVELKGSISIDSEKGTGTKRSPSHVALTLASCRVLASTPAACATAIDRQHPGQCASGGPT
ncbi:MAG: ATP-binding protein [Acidobacteriota bacterium]